MWVKNVTFQIITKVIKNTNLKFCWKILKFLSDLNSKTYDMNDITVSSLESYCFESKADKFQILLVTNEKHYYYTNPGFSKIEDFDGFLDSTIFSRGEMGDVYYKAVKEAQETTFITSGLLQPLEVLPFD
jgi:hypothetical protein